MRGWVDSGIQLSENEKNNMRNTFDKRKKYPIKKQFHLSGNYYFYDVVNVEFFEIDVV